MDVNYTAGGHTKIGWLKIERRGGGEGGGRGCQNFVLFCEPYEWIIPKNKMTITYHNMSVTNLTRNLNYRNQTAMLLQNVKLKIWKSWHN